MANSVTELQKKDYLNQSNIISKAFTKVSSPTSYKIIKYGLYKLDKQFNLKKYQSVNLFDETNWNKIDFNDFTCEFSISDFCKTLKVSDGSSLRKPIFEMLNNAAAETIFVQSGDNYTWFPFFVKAEYQDTKKIKLVFNPGVIGVALDNESFYTHLELEELGKLRTTYSIRYYELIMSYYNMKGRYRNKAGSWKTDLLTIEYLRDYLQIDDNAYAGRTDNFKKNCVEKPINELCDKCTNLLVEIETVKEGPKIVGFILHCEEKIKTLRIAKDDSKSLKDMKSSLNEADVKIAAMKEKYPEEWKKFEEELNPAERKEMMFSALLDGEILEKMEKEGFTL